MWVMKVIPTKLYNIIGNTLPMIVLFSLVMILYRIICVIITKEKTNAFKELKMLIYIIYCFLLFKLVTTTDFESYSNNFIPFKEMFRYSLTSKLFYRNVIGNILLFVPFGYFVSYYCKLPSVKYNLLITVITSTSIETIQSAIGRSFDIDDIILNVIGGVCGYVIFLITKKLLRKYPDALKNNLLLNLLGVITIMVLVVIILNLYGVRL